MNPPRRRSSHRMAAFVRAAGAAAALVLTLTAAAPAGQTASPGFPPQVEKYLSGVVHPTPDERKRLLAGAPVSRLLPADGSHEVGVFGAVWINAPIQRY